MRIVLWDEKCPSANEVMYNKTHWAVRAKEANRIHEQVRYFASIQYPIEAPDIEWHYPVKVTVTAYLKGRLIDCSNIPIKLFEDGLRLAGVIQDDSPKYVGAVEARGTQGHRWQG